MILSDTPSLFLITVYNFRDTLQVQVYVRKMYIKSCVTRIRVEAEQADG